MNRSLPESTALHRRNYRGVVDSTCVEAPVNRRLTDSGKLRTVLSMARPKGLRLNRAALTDILAIKVISLTEAASLCGMPLTTLSSLAHGDHRASPRTVRALAEGLNVSAETLFPEMVFPELRGAA